MHYVQAEVCGHFLYALGSDAFRLRGVSVNQCVFTDRVDQPRGSTRLLVYFGDRLRREKVGRTCASGHMKTAIDVTAGFVEIKRAEVRAHCNTLLQLS